jgi:hypothetical protein
MHTVNTVSVCIFCPQEYSVYSSKIRYWKCAPEVVKKNVGLVCESVLRLSCRLDDRGIVVWFRAGTSDFSLLQSVLNGSGTQPVGTRGCFFRGRMASWPFTPGWHKAYDESSYTCNPSYAYMAYTRKTLLYYIHMAGRMTYVKLRRKRQRVPSEH